MQIEGVNTTILWSFEEMFTDKSNKGVISLWSAASYWGFAPKDYLKMYITYPKGYNRNFKSNSLVKKQRTGKKYYGDIEQITFYNKSMNVYKTERTIVEIIKEAKGQFDAILIETIETFIRVCKYEYPTIIMWAKEFNVENVVRALFSMGHGDFTKQVYEI